MNANENMTAAILFHVALNVAPSASLLTLEAMRDADADALFAFAESLAAVHGSHAEAETRAALLDYVTVRDADDNCPDMQAARVALLETYADKARALVALQDATGSEPDADDVGMILSAYASDLAGWCDDLETRCGFANIAAFRDALSIVEDEAFRRECATAQRIAESLLSPARRDAGWIVAPADPRGETDGGADLYNDADPKERVIFLHRSPSHVDGGGWVVSVGGNWGNDTETDCTAAGGVLDVDKARTAIADALRDIGADVAAALRKRADGAAFGDLTV